MKSLFQINTTTPLLVVLLVVTTAFTARAQGSRIQMSSLDHLAPKANEAVDVNIDERLMKMAVKVFSDKDADEKEVKELVAGLKGIYVKSFEFDAEGQYSAADVESIRVQLRAPDWTRLVNVTSKKEGTFEVYMLMNGEQIGGLVVLSAEDKELTVVNIVGPVDLEKLAKLEGQLGVPDLGIETTKPKTKNDKN